MRSLFTVEGMSCQHCVKHVTEAIKSVQSVESVTISLEAKQVEIISLSHLDFDAIKNAIEDAGYDVLSMTEA